MKRSDQEIEAQVRLDLPHLCEATAGPEDSAFRALYAHVRRRQLQLDHEDVKLVAFNVALDLMQAEFPAFEPRFDLEYFCL
jgi:hypothetical protein